MAKLMLIDGNSILNRAFYGLQGNMLLRTSDGLYTNAVYGFLNIMNKYLAEDNPEYIAVAFDLRAPTFRHKKFEAYKAQRKGMPEELVCQVPLIKELLDAMKIKRFEIAGYEADDIIGTLATRAEDEGLEAIIVTGDKDSFQLVSDSITVKNPVTKAGRTETDIYTPEKVEERYGSGPECMVDIKGLMGDPSDNIPGIPGVGEKTAVELIKQYSTIENIYEHIEDITKKALKEKLLNNKELAFLSRELSVICRDVPVEWDLDDMKNEDPDEELLYDVFSKLQFKSLIKKYNLKPPKGQEANVDLSVFEKRTEDIYISDSNVFQREMKAFKEYMRENQDLTVIVEFGRDKVGTPRTLTLFAQNYKCLIIEILEEGTFGMEVPESELCEELGKLLPDIKIVGHDVKAFVVYQKYMGNKNITVDFDTALAMYVIDPSQNKSGVEKLAEIYLGIEEGKLTNSADRVRAVSILKPYMEAAMKNDDQMDLYYKIELPLIHVLSDMECQGFKINTNELEIIGRKLDERIAELTDMIYEEAHDNTFNINSPKQLGVILFERLALNSGAKTSSKAYSTSAEVLEEIEDQHPIVPLILEYRQYTKLKSTYIEGLISVKNQVTGKIHSSLNQTITVTGRLSSTEPNLQNIPVRMELGREIRKAFIPSDSEHILLDADYSQIELRVLAHITEDECMCDAFMKNEDIHTRTASEVFNVPFDEVTSQDRSRAKAVNFGIVYGIGDLRLAKDLGITRQEARNYMDEYLENFSSVRDYMKNIIQKGKRDGYVTTVFGRHRYIPELLSPNFKTRSFGERVALNTPIQGTAADIIKIAMIDVYNELKNRGLKSRLILQVHDELIIDTFRSEKEEVADILKKSMENAADLKVPLQVDVKEGESWFYAK